MTEEELWEEILHAGVLAVRKHGLTVEALEKNVAAAISAAEKAIQQKIRGMDVGNQKVPTGRDAYDRMIGALRMCNEPN